MPVLWICFFAGLQIGATLVNAPDDPDDVDMEDMELNGLEDSKDQECDEVSEDEGAQESQLM